MQLRIEMTGGLGRVSYTTTQKPCTSTTLSLGFLMFLGLSFLYFFFFGVNSESVQKILVTLRNGASDASQAIGSERANFELGQVVEIQGREWLIFDRRESIAASPPAGPCNTSFCVNFTTLQSFATPSPWAPLRGPWSPHFVRSSRCPPPCGGVMGVFNPCCLMTVSTMLHWSASVAGSHRGVLGSQKLPHWRPCAALAYPHCPGPWRLPLRMARQLWPITRGRMASTGAPPSPSPLIIASP